MSEYFPNALYVSPLPLQYVSGTNPLDKNGTIHQRSLASRLFYVSEPEYETEYEWNVWKKETNPCHTQSIKWDFVNPSLVSISSPGFPQRM